LENGITIRDQRYDRFKRYFICDAGYDSKVVHERLKENGFYPLIEQNKRGVKNKKLIRRMTKHEYKIYCKRVKVENVICRLKQMRRINLRYDCSIISY
jgi:hypothetical protein